MQALRQREATVYATLLSSHHAHVPGLAEELAGTGTDVLSCKQQHAS